ncbi:MAG: hypothetical protein AB1391_03650 [Candidatus Micrarchaeota archaeon]
MNDVKADVEKAFQTTFKIIFGSECKVKIEDLKDYLWKYHYPLEKKKSKISGKDVYLGENRYCGNVISYDEIDFKKSYALDINEIKDIDSIVEAVKDRIQYCGNTLSGKTDFVSESDCVTDSFYIYNSHHFFASKYAAYSSYVRDASEYIFGCSYFFNSKSVTL